MERFNQAISLWNKVFIFFCLMVRLLNCSKTVRNTWMKLLSHLSCKHNICGNNNFPRLLPCPSARTIFFCLGQNQICPRQNDFVQDNIFLGPRQKFCPQLKNHFCFEETSFKPCTKFLSWTKNILSWTKLFCLGQIWFCPGQKIFCPGRWTGQ